MFGIGADRQRMVDPARALRGRDAPMPVASAHHVHQRPIAGEALEQETGLQRVQFGMGCFWGAERKFWAMPGVFTTAVGYAGGYTPNATYREVCSGETGHTEVVLVVYTPKGVASGDDRAQVSFEQLLKAFWESHDPTQGMRQGNDTGTQYRSAIYCETEDQYRIALASRDAYQLQLSAAGHGAITTEIVFPAPTFYYAEDEHQQYLAKNPGGYCGLGGTGVSCAVGIEPTPA